MINDRFRLIVRAATGGAVTLWANDRQIGEGRTITPSRFRRAEGFACGGPSA